MIDEDRTNVEALLRSMAARLLAFADDLHCADGLRRDDGLHGDAEAAIAEFFSAGQPFRDFKAQTARGVQAAQSEVRAHTGSVESESQLHETTLDIDPAHWQHELLESAKQGERITSFAGDYRAAIRRQPII
jgi:prephenate dehydrogenase